MKINNYIEKTKVEGPGTRFCIWVQGCSIRCRGCANTHMWDINEGTKLSCDEIYSKISEVKDEIEGITFLGGEPLDQIDEVITLSKEVQNIGLSVVIFTGYKFEELNKKEKFIELKKYVDILIDGEFVEEQKDFSRPWVGSKNQKYYFLSDRYSEEILEQYRNKFEIRIQNDQTTMNGMGDISKIKNICNL